jgi:hypothetical protein
MDTRFWGPSGWALLHLIAATPIEHKRQHKVKEWFDLLEYVLPCKYCRASFHDYTQIQPLTAAIIGSKDAFARWLFEIHNRVNAKLRGQGLLTSPDPSWVSVKAKYDEQSKNLCDSTPLVGWDFMTSVAFSTPFQPYKTVPMPDTPDHTGHLTLGERNRYNLLTRKERLAKLRRWWSLNPSILPCSAWRAHWTSAVETSGSIASVLGRSQETVMSRMWQIEKQVCAGLHCQLPHPSLPVLKQEVAAFESKCGSLKKGLTCRTRKNKQRRVAMTQRVRRLRKQVLIDP